MHPEHPQHHVQRAKHLPTPTSAKSPTQGDYNKEVFCYDRPWWRDQGFNGYFVNYAGLAILGHDTSVDKKYHYSLTCFVNGQRGRDWGKLLPHERRAAVLQQLARIFNADAGPLNSEVFRPIEMFDQI